MGLLLLEAVVAVIAGLTTALLVWRSDGRRRW
jgi:hypothetical protein